jgi:hypothetical protein
MTIILNLKFSFSKLNRSEVQVKGARKLDIPINYLKLNIMTKFYYPTIRENINISDFSIIFDTNILLYRSLNEERVVYYFLLFNFVKVNHSKNWHSESMFSPYVNLQKRQKYV